MNQKLFITIPQDKFIENKFTITFPSALVFYFFHDFHPLCYSILIMNFLLEMSYWDSHHGGPRAYFCELYMNPDAHNRFCSKPTIISSIL